MKKMYLLVRIGLIIFLVACNKKDADKPLTKTDLLTTGSWMLTAVMSDEDGDGIYETNRFQEFETCFTDNIWTFKNNGILVMDEGNTKCSASDPQNNETDWQLADNETTLTIHLDSWILQELSTTTLKWKELYSDNQSAIVTFSKH